MLELKNISAGYGKASVLQDVSISVEKGSVLSIIGPNGSGKSTLLKTVVGILKPTKGTITVDGKTALNITEKQFAQHVAYLPQGKDVPDMTVGQMVLHGRFPYLGFPRRYTENDRKLAIASLERMGVADLYDRPLKTLSGGIRQKVYIAMALAQDTDYILLDEPTTYLDIQHQLELMKILRELAKSGKGIVAVMHDLPLAFNFSDRIAVMNEGKIVAENTPEALCNSGLIEEFFNVSVIKSPNTDTYCIGY